METEKKQENIKENKYKVHHVLAHSYFIYLVFFVFGIVLDILFPVKFFENSLMVTIGFIFLILSTFLIFWAQRTSRNLKKGEINKEVFCKGPYCWTRSPTHWGLFLLLLSFGIIVNAFFVMVFTILAFIITKLTLVKKQESILVKKYGEPYIEYKKTVKF